jgi:anaerobic selenocysteine-containing dehydrogenase
MISVMLGADATVRTTCPRDCYDSCGIVVVRRGGRVRHVRGDPAHPVSRGRLCVKCSIGYNGVWRDPSARITEPLVRRGGKGAGEFRQATWDEALDLIAKRLGALVDSGKASTIVQTHYTGTFALLGYSFPLRFFNRIGATEVDPDTVCNKAGHVALDYVYGSSEDGFDPRTANESRCIVVWGANPSVCAPHVDEHWLGEAPGAVVVVDPVRTPTAARADLHLQPFPGTDAALAFALLHVIARDGLLDRRFITEHVLGWEELAPLLEPCTPAWGERATGVAAADIEAAGHLYAPGPSLLWLGQGLQRQRGGGNVMRACAALPAVTGNLGRRGAGVLYLNGSASRGIDDDYVTASHLSEDAPPTISQMDLAAAIEDPARTQALVCWNINIAASNPQQARLRRALRRDDLFTVAIDLFQTDTVDHADVVLPAASFLESDDIVVPYFNLSLAAQVKADEPPGSALPNSEIFRCLARRMGLADPELYESDRDVLEEVLRRSGCGETFASLAAAGTIAHPADPVVQFADLAFPTQTGRIELASPRAEADGHPRLPTPHHDARPGGGRLRLLTPASPWAMNDSFTNDPKITRRIGAATIGLHPLDAAERGLAEGDLAAVTNDTGRLELRVALTDDLPRGVAFSQKGRWPKHEPGGANVNALNPGEHADMGRSTAVHSVEVTVTSAREPQPVRRAPR